MMNEKIFDRQAWLYESTTVTQLHLEDESLEPVEIYDCEIIGAKLSGSTLKRWIFEQCIFKDSDLSNITFDHCVFENCTFISCRLIGSNWNQSQSYLQQLSFESCDLSLSQLSNNNLAGVIFTDCQCSEVDFSQSTLTKARFLNTYVTNALFEGTNLEDAHLVGALGECFQPSESKLTQATVSVNTAIRMVNAMGIQVAVDQHS
jgi:fluoroquinolone resistance protein